MLKIKHTLCPSCSVGCGINVVSHEGDVVGTYPYKRHPVNEGKNCLNGRNSIEAYKIKAREILSNRSVMEESEKWERELRDSAYIKILE